MNTLTDPYLGEDDGQRQQPTIDKISALLRRLRRIGSPEHAIEQIKNAGKLIDKIAGE